MTNHHTNALAIYALTLTLYSLTVPLTLTLEDAGLFQMVCHLGGISHPPGYPLYTSLCQLIVPLVPNGVIAGNFLSASFAAAACVLLYSCARLITRDTRTALVAALAYGVSATFWSQAIIIEVYSLAVLLFLVCLRSVLRYRLSAKPKWLYLAAFSFGLCLSNHWPMTLLSSLSLVILMLPARHKLTDFLQSPVRAAALLLALFAGLSPYLLLLQADPEISLLGEINSVEQFLGLVTRSTYVDQHVVATGTDQIHYLGWLVRESLSQLGWFASPFILTGLVISCRRLPANLSTALICLFLGTTLLLNCLLGFSYEFFWQAVYRPYPIIAYAVVALWFAMGITCLRDYLSGKLWSTLTGLLLITVCFTNYQANDRRTPGWPEHYGRQLLASLPENAVYFAADDLEVGVLGYLHLIEDIRPDVELRNPQNLLFRNRLISPFAHSTLQQDRLDTYVTSTDRPVFASSYPFSPREHHGAYYRYTPDQPNSAINRPALGSLFDDLLSRYTDGSMVDDHEKHYALLRLIEFSRHHVQLALRGELSADGLRRLNRLQTTLPGKLATLEVLLPLNNPEAKPALMAMAQSAAKAIPDFVPRQARGLIFEYLGRAALMEPAEHNLAMGYFRKAVSIYPAPTNTSLCPLSALLAQQQLTDELTRLKSDYPRIRCEL